MILEYIFKKTILNGNEFYSGLPCLKSLPALTGAPSVLETPSLHPFLETYSLTSSHPTLLLSTLHCFPYRATDSWSPDDWEGEGFGSLELRMTMKREIQVLNDHLTGQIIHSKMIKTGNKPTNKWNTDTSSKMKWKWPWYWQIAGKRDRVTKCKI